MNRQRAIAIALIIMSLGASIAILISFTSCSQMQNPIKTFEEMSSQEKVTWLMGVYNRQFESSMRLSGYDYNEEESKWVKVANPELTREQIDILKKKKDILEDVYPMIMTYESLIALKEQPSSNLEAAILLLLEKLLEL